MDIIFNFLGQFFLIILSFLIAVISAVCKTTLDNKKWPKNVTGFGWLLVVSSAIVCLISIGQFIDTTKLNQSLQLNSLLEIEKAIAVSLEPFYLVTDDVSPENRFQLVNSFTPFDNFDSLCKVDIHKNVSTNSPFFAHRKSLEQTWGYYLSDTSQTLRTTLLQISSSFGIYLDFNLLKAISDVVSHPYLDFWQYSYVREQRHKKTDKIPNDTSLCNNTHEQISKTYLNFQEDYLNKLSLLENLVKQKNEKISKILERKTCPPFFLKQAGSILTDCK